MEVKLEKRYPLAASVEQAWTVLADVRATAACMPGAAITEQLDDTHYKGVVKTKVGPAVMQFEGQIEVLALESSTRTLQMLGKGADRAGSSASMNLTANIEPGEAPDQSVLVGSATVSVNGKLAQFGNRLLVPVSDAMLAQFAGSFSKAAAAVPTVAPNELLPEVADLAADTYGVAIPATATATGTASASASASASANPNPNASAHPKAPISPPFTQPTNELNALGLLWSVFKRWLAGLFVKKKG